MKLLRAILIWGTDEDHEKPEKKQSVPRYRFECNLQALRLCEIVRLVQVKGEATNAQRGSRFIALLFP